PRVFIATKLEEYRAGAEAAEARQSLQRLKTDKVDALQLHNVSNARQDLGGLNALKAQGLCRYTGITTTFKGAYDAAEAILKRGKPDFLEIDYAINNRDRKIGCCRRPWRWAQRCWWQNRLDGDSYFVRPWAASCPIGRRILAVQVGASTSIKLVLARVYHKTVRVERGIKYGGRRV
ncbi:MAG: aldo/keto reductase, partial [Pseudomonadota bacterium]|nr:aldo/keto reductase [Pseudomonadota bacterium]